ncbi:STAS domain-containing protein [Chlorobium phaeovibrioides]|uniref:Anti-sigma factor antagonist n=1 Tax=Chlorobium phaeovibrioides TaxID=1094 RepID=A0A3S0MQ88_CHLPH|nr:STAS domain-containing protein [Chlorobium phaeovibrioides]MWV54138.1 STAS domain-containing protein [Chlorobium phaeovibrioides]QEQ57655.1 STAS domain-containing protein [Chlorobium phaeovibrioides]RTY37758.1 anti-sigma factor antagonist [Chlorobium phaeovibrioides]
MEFTVDTSAGVRVGVAILPERIDAASCAELQAAAAGWLKQTANLVFDCSGLDFIDSSGLGVLVSTLRKTIEQDGDLKLACLGMKASMLMELTKAKRLFSIHPDAVSAIAAFHGGVRQ